MSTNACIAVHTGMEGDTHAFKGVWHHWDGYPDCLGATIFECIEYYGDVESALDFLTSHKWSTINGADFSLDPIPSNMDTDNKCVDCGKDRLDHLDKDHDIRLPPRCLCCRDGDQKDLITHENHDKWIGIEYIYAINISEGKLYFAEYENYNDNDKKEWIWREYDLSRDLSPEEWGYLMACGEDYRRCKHNAEVHFPYLEDTPSGKLSTHKYLEYEPLDPFDACGVVVKDSGENNGKWDIVYRHDHEDRLTVTLRRADFDPSDLDLTWKEKHLLHREKVIQAVKSIREREGYSLKESKNIADEYRNELKHKQTPVTHINLDEGRWNLMSNVERLIYPDTISSEDGVGNAIEEIFTTTIGRRLNGSS